MSVPQEVKLARHAGDLDDDGHDIYATGNFVTKVEGGQDTIKAHGSSGSTETFDPTDGNVHTVTLNANCTFTLNAPVGSGAATLEIYALQDGTGGRAITWPGSVVWPGGTTPTPTTTPNTTTRYILETIDGGTTWYGAIVGSGGVDLSAIDFLVGTASGDLSGEIVVGTTPGGELGGTWPSPTVDATHSGSSHAATQAAAEATAAAALAAHVAAGGSSVTDHEHIVNVAFSGDGSATVWELPAAPVAADAIAVYIAGSRSLAWVLSGALLTTLTFDSAPASAANNIVIDIVAATA